MENPSDADGCRTVPGTMVPRIDRDRCEGKAECLDVCPYGVFEVRRIDDADFVRLSFFGRLKSRAHDRMTAYTPRASECHACGLCVEACPEQAIELVAIAPSVTTSDYQPADYPANALSSLRRA